MSQVPPLLKQIPNLLALVTADGAYDGEPVCRAVAERQFHPRVVVVIPPHSTAMSTPGSSTAPSQRKQHIQMIEDKGRMGWQKAIGYDQQSHAETAMFRNKAVFGSSLRACTLLAQKTETTFVRSALNRMARLGMPMPQRVC